MIHGRSARSSGSSPVVERYRLGAMTSVLTLSNGILMTRPRIDSCIALSSP
jgi:hypothetical protein